MAIIKGLGVSAVISRVKSYSDVIFIVFSTFVFLFILPSLIAALGTLGSIYIDGLAGISPYGLKAASAAIGMLIISYVACCFLKADKKFIRTPAILTFIGVVLLPFYKGSLGVLTDTTGESPALQIQKGLEAVAQTIIQIAPIGLCTIAVIMLAVELIILSLKKYRKI